MYMYVCVCVYIYIYIHVYIYYVCVPICIYIYMCVCVCAFVYIHTHTQRLPHMCIQAHEFARACTHTSLDAIKSHQPCTVGDLVPMHCSMQVRVFFFLAYTRYVSMASVSSCIHSFSYVRSSQEWAYITARQIRWRTESGMVGMWRLYSLQEFAKDVLVVKFLSRTWLGTI